MTYSQPNGQSAYLLSEIPAEIREWFQPVPVSCYPRIPSVVLDPFAGSGTSLLVALQLGRRAIGCEASQTYADEVLARRMNGVELAPLPKVEQYTGGRVPEEDL